MGWSLFKRRHPFPIDFLWHIFSGKLHFLPVASSNDCFIYPKLLLYLLLQIFLIIWTPTMIFSDSLCVKVIINFTCSNPTLWHLLLPKSSNVFSANNNIGVSCQVLSFVNFCPFKLMVSYLFYDCFFSSSCSSVKPSLGYVSHTSIWRTPAF